ncbi:MAG: hypothetical protein M1824_004431 [Vezdaea acicularis]|nr:MAG: hypothetical protein M1824_004431 [Vezdaea acicularis]
MPPSSPLTIATRSLVRLTREERSYHKEMAEQQAAISRIPEDENAQFTERQQRQAIQETIVVIAKVKDQIRDAAQKVEDQLVSVNLKPLTGSRSEIMKGEVDPEEAERAREALEDAQGAISDAEITNGA